VVQVTRRGYLFTVLGYLLVGTIFSLAVFFSNLAFEERSRTTVLNGFSKATLVADSIESSLAGVYGISAVSSNSSLTIRDHITADYDISGLLGSYLSYLNSSFGSITATNISLASGGLAFRVSPGDFTYDYDSFSKNTVRVYSSSGPPGSYSLALFVPASSVVGTTDSRTFPGSFPAYVEFNKSNVGHIWTGVNGPVDVNACSWYFMDFDGGASSLNVSVGDCLGYKNSLIVRSIGGQKADLLIVMNLTSPSMLYSSNLSVSDRASGFSVSRYPVLSSR